MGNNSSNGQPQLTGPHKSFQTLLDKAQSQFKSCQFLSALKTYKKIEKQMSERSLKEKRALAALYQVIAVIYSKQARHPKALEYLNKAMELGSDESPEGNWFAATVWRDLGYIYSAQENFDQALESFEKMLEISSMLGNNEGELLVADAYREISGVYRKVGKHEESLSSLSTAYNIKMKKLEPDDISIADLFDDFGTICHEKGKASEALSYYKKALDIRIKKHGNKHDDIMKSLILLASLYKDQKQYKHAVHYFNMVSNILFRKQSPNQEIAYNLYEGLGFVYMGMGNDGDSLCCYMKALEICYQSFGKVHPNVAKIYDQMGHVYESCKRLPDALKCFKKAVDIRLKVMDDAYLSIASIYQSISSVCKELGKESEAELAMKRANIVAEKGFMKNRLWARSELPMANLTLIDVDKDIETQEGCVNETNWQSQASELEAKICVEKGQRERSDTLESIDITIKV